MNRSEFDQFKEDIESELKQSSASFDLGLPDGFVEFLIAKGVFFDCHFKEAAKSISIASSVAGNCFHNSQLISIQNAGISYFEGIMRGKHKKSVLHHGFNVIKDCVLDISYMSNSKEFVESLNDNDFFYFAVEIPYEYYQNDKRLLDNKTLNNPLLLKYFNDTQNGNE